MERQVNDMERLTTKNVNTGEPCLNGEVEFIALSKDCNPLLRKAINKLSKYEDTGLSPEEVEQLKLSDESKEDCTIEQHNRIKELESSCDYWEREAKKWCDQLASIRKWLKPLNISLEEALKDAEKQVN